MKKMSLKDYEILIHVTKMKGCEDNLYHHRQDNITQFLTFCFRGSVKKCPKYYYFTKSMIQHGEFFSQDYYEEIIVSLSKKKQLIQQTKIKQQLANFKIQRVNNQIFITPIRSYKADEIPLYHMVRLFKDGFKIQQGDNIKLGMNFLKAIFIKGQNNQEKIKNSQRSTSIAKIQKFNPKEQILSSNQQQRGCKICLQKGEKEDTSSLLKGYLIRPCQCKEPVHVECLQQWIKTKSSPNPMPNIQNLDFQLEQVHSSRVNVINYLQFKCQICHAFLPIRFKIQNQIYDLQDQIPFDFELNKLEVGMNKQIVKVKQLQKGPLKIGRNQENQIIFSDQSVSRKHAQFQKDPKSQYGVIIKDRQEQVPKYGTLVEVNKNNQKILLPFQQRRGFQIQDHIIIFELKEKQVVNQIFKSFKQFKQRW